MAVGSEERVTIESDGARIDGRIAVPADAASAIVFCHPHPAYGGDMHNSVVLAVLGTLAERGWATLRFDFRGVGASSGTLGDRPGELADAAAALDLLRRRCDAKRMVLGGYSYGATVALELGPGRDDVDALLAVAPPFSMFPADGLPEANKPLALIAGDRDEFCDSASFAAAAARFGPLAQSVEVPGADHFWFGRESELQKAVVRLIDGD